MPIESAADLQAHLALAVEVELSTIPPYLYAMYSIEDHSSEAAQLIKSIVAEEMLHVVLSTNLLLAVGGAPRFASPAVLPSYPGLLPHHTPDLVLNLAPASPDVIRHTFMVIEQPEAPNALPEEDEYETLGQFYFAVEHAIDRLAASTDLFASPQRSRQLSDPAFYAPVADSSTPPAATPC